MNTLWDQFQEIFYTLEKNRLRTFLTGLTVSWGIFMLILLLGAGRGMENGVRQSFEKDAVNSIWINPGQTSIAHTGFKQGRHILFYNDDLSELDRSISQRELSSGRSYLNYNTIVRHGSISGRFFVLGVHPDYMKIEHSQAVLGRLLHFPDDTTARKVAIIGKNVQKELFQRNNGMIPMSRSHGPGAEGVTSPVSDTPIGKYIYIKGIPFRVVGVFDDPDDRWQLERIYIPISTFQRVFSRNERLHNMVMTVKSDKEEEQIESDIRQILARRHHFSTEDRRALFFYNTLAEYRKYMALFANIRRFIWVIGMGSIVAGIVGISNIMLITVRERTKEIGIRKALGAPPGAIIRMILMESLLITVGFGYLGIVAGVALLELLGNMLTGVEYFKNPEIDLGIAFGALAILVFSGVTAGLFPALRASRIRPVEALRDE